MKFLPKSIIKTRFYFPKNEVLPRIVVKSENKMKFPLGKISLHVISLLFWLLSKTIYFYKLNVICREFQFLK